MLNGLYGSDWNDPKTMATLTMAAGLMSGRNFGDSLGRGLGGYQAVMQNADEAEARKSERAYNDLVRQMKLEEIKKAQEKERAQQQWRSQLPALMQPKLQGTDAATNQIAAENAEFGDFGVQKLAELRSPLGIGYGVDRKALDAHLMSPDSPFADKLLERQLFPKEAEPFTLGEGQVRYGSDGRVIAQGPQKAPDLPSEVRAYQFAQDQGYSGSFQDWVMSQKRASAPSVAVNMSDPTAVAKAAMDFQKQYRDATKPSYSRATAYNAMLEASRNPSPKSDLTMVYSFIKALDPESVVREGEIDLVNANRAIPDRIKGYANRLATGESLLPHERKDLLEQARTLSFTDYTRSRKDVQAYRENAQRLGLDPELYAPDPYTGVDFGPRALGGKQVKRTGTYGGRKVIEYTDGSVEYAN